MGLGKTVQTISLLAYLVESKSSFGPFLVIVPLTTLSNWVLEFERWVPTMAKIVYRGAPHERKQLHASVMEAKFNALITTYDYVMKDRTVLGRVPWKYLVRYIWSR